MTPALPRPILTTLTVDGARRVDPVWLLDVDRGGSSDPLDWAPVLTAAPPADYLAACRHESEVTR